MTEISHTNDYSLEYYWKILNDPISKPVQIQEANKFLMQFKVN